MAEKVKKGSRSPRKNRQENASEKLLEKVTTGVLGTPLRRHLVFISAIILITLAVYSNTFHSPFVFDDNVSISDNQIVRNFSFLSFLSERRPVTYFTFAINYKLGGLDTFGYHIFNNALHILTGIVIYFLVYITLTRFKFPERLRLRPDTISVATALLFTVHPIQTEAVTYISSRSDGLATFFMLASLMLFALWVKTRWEKLLYFLLPFGYYCALFSKQIAIVFPALVLLYDFYFVAELSARNLIRRWIHYLLLALVSLYGIYVNFFVHVFASAAPGGGGVSAAGERSAGFAPVGDLLSPYEYFSTQLRVIVKYIQLMFVPVGQNLDYDFAVSKSLFEPTVILSGLFLLALVVLAVWLVKRMRLVSFGILWFFIALAPTSSILPIIDVIFEHRLYFPSPGIILAFVILVDQLPFKKARTTS